jgi:hypothetical protein
MHVATEMFEGLSYMYKMYMYMYMDYAICTCVHKKPTHGNLIHTHTHTQPLIALGARGGLIEILGWSNRVTAEVTSRKETTTPCIM